jgi:hypothetical protein
VQATTFGYADSKSPDGITNYSAFNSFVYEQPNNFCYEIDNLSKAIDFYVAKVDFGSNPSAGTKTKLDAINTYYATHNNHVNTFHKDFVQDININNPLFIGGFPAGINDTKPNYGKST